MSGLKQMPVSKKRQGFDACILINVGSWINASLQQMPGL